MASRMIIIVQQSPITSMERATGQVESLRLVRLAMRLSSGGKKKCSD
jgi:hypothetical protein